MIFKSINARSKDARLYDIASGAMTNKVYADGKGLSYDYDAHGRLTKRTWARGINTFYSYDGWGNLTNTTYSDNTPTVTLAYDAMGRQVRAVDAAGVTTFAYDVFGPLTNETVVGVAGTNTIERYYDACGRDAGYALNGVRRSTLAYDPATGRLASMQIPTIEDEQNHCPPPPLFSTFQWTYLQGSDLKSSLAYPNGLTASWTYGNRGELLEVNNASPTGTISRYAYTYDAAGRRVTCVKSGTAFEQPDSVNYGYNTRSELTSATAAVDSDYRYGYNFDDIGNRKTSSERGTNSVYTASQLNQYTAVDDFTPTYDADGNETLVKTATGIWNVIYNGENRPVRWTQGDTVITMSFDRMGRRVTKNDQRFVYNGYLQIANFRSTTTTSDYNYFVWDPTEAVATRPLVWNLSTVQPFNSSTFFYTHDGNKNVSEVIASDGTLAAHYEYAPFCALTVSRGVSAADNPWRFSSEYAEDDTATVYYNYRHYEPVTGRWMSRDYAGELYSRHLYAYVGNCAFDTFDVLGLFGDGYETKCVKSHVEIRYTGLGCYAVWVCDEYIEEPTEHKGHSQFSNNGTECPFDYTKEDRGWSNPFLMPWRHFQDLPTSESKVQSAVDSCDAAAFERAMHQAQDYYAHYGKGYRWWKGGHIFDGTAPDEDDDAWDMADKLTQKWLSEWKSKCCLACPKNKCKWVKKNEGKCAQ